MSPETRDAVSTSTAMSTEKRAQILWQDYEDPDALRHLAGNIKQHTLEHLDQYLEQAVTAMQSKGIKVHFAPAGDDAKAIILDILKTHDAKKVVKSKSMATEEIHLNPYLEENGVECLESDLGEFIVQLDDDEPSHIVKPIIHKNRREIAETFLREKIAW